MAIKKVQSNQLSDKIDDFCSIVDSDGNGELDFSEMCEYLTEYLQKSLHCKHEFSKN